MRAENKAYRNWKFALGDKDSLKRTAKRLRKKEVRKHETQIQTARVKQIEDLKSRDPKKYWKKLKQFGKNAKEKKTLPSQMKDENDQWVVDKKAVMEVWAKSFENLGMEEKSTNFDEKFADQVTKSVKDKAQQDLDAKQLPSLLDQDIQFAEIQRAIKNLKRGKATGIDKYMNEIFMYGGEKVIEATWRLCVEVFRTEKYLKIGHEA